MPTPEKEQAFDIKAYKTRWLVLSISFFNGALRCFCQSCYGQVNNVLVRLLRVEPWQIDWLVITYSIILMVMAIPFSWVAIRIGFRKSVILMSVIVTVGFSLILVGVRVNYGYYFILAGQAVTSISTMVGIGLMPLVAAIWFPANQVAIAIAIQMVARGTGEALGSAIPPLLVNVHQSRSEIRFGLTLMFVPMVLLAATLSLASHFFVPDAPPLPPSTAQLKKIRAEAKNEITLKRFILQIYDVMKKVVFSPQFLIVTLVSSILCPLLRCYTILLSSMLHKNFSGEPNLNKHSGFALLGSWVLFTISALASGPLITKSERYRAVMIVSAIITSVSCTMVFLGMYFNLLLLVYTGVLLIGIGAGSANTCKFELLVEVTYPISPHLVLSLSLVVLGCFRTTYPILMRALLTNYGASVATALPVSFAIVGLLLISSVPMRFKRWEAENFPEMAPLLE